MSMVVPGVKGTTTVINRDGYCSCAAAPAQTAIAVASTNAAKLALHLALLAAHFEAFWDQSRTTARTGDASAPMMLSGKPINATRSLVMRSKFLRYGMVTMPCSLRVREL